MRLPRFDGLLIAGGGGYAEGARMMLPHFGVMVRRCHSSAVRWWPAVRVGLAGYWTAGIAWAAMSWLHWRWLWRSTHAGEVLSAYGSGLVVLGLWVAVLELVRVGITETARRQVGQEPVWFAEQLPAAEASEKSGRRRGEAHHHRRACDRRLGRSSRNAGGRLRHASIPALGSAGMIER